MLYEPSPFSLLSTVPRATRGRIQAAIDGVDKEGLSPDQVTALVGVLSAVDRKVSEVALIGYAGTGKTTLTARIVQALQDLVGVLVTAPTHKAAHQLGMRLGSEVRTIHSALKMKQVTDLKSGARSFQPDRDPRNKGTDWPSIRLLVVDEASMVGVDLLRHIREAVCSGTTILWVGDAAQLPPVGESSSPAFSQAEETYRLEHVHRYDGAILVEAGKIRAALFEDDRYAPVPGISPGEGVVTYPRGKTGGWGAAAKEAFRAGTVSGRSTKVVCWTNAAVKLACEAIHQSLYGEGADPWQVGQRVVAMNPYSQRNEDGEFCMVMSSSEEAEILAVEKVLSADGVACWRLTLRPEFGSVGTFTANVVADEGLRRFQERQTELKSLAIMCAPDTGHEDWGGRCSRCGGVPTPGERCRVGEDQRSFTSRKKRAWAVYYGFEESFLWIEKTYASTVHKAQGSTYDEVFINLPDIKKNRDRREMLRCLYTAVTRASTTLHVLSDE